MTATTSMKSKAITYIHELPDETLPSALSYLRYLSEKKHPLEVTSIEEVYARIEEGLEDVRQGRVRPFREAMQDIRRELAQYGV